MLKSLMSRLYNGKMRGLRGILRRSFALFGAHFLVHFAELVEELIIGSAELQAIKAVACSRRNLYARLVSLVLVVHSSPILRAHQAEYRFYVNNCSYRDYRIYSITYVY